MNFSMRKMVLAVLAACAMAVPAMSQDTIVTALASVHQANGNGLYTREVTDTVVLPHDLTPYGQIHMLVIVSCPTGGCEPWSRYASVEVYHDSEWYEIGRYFTPFGS